VEVQMSVLSGLRRRRGPDTPEGGVQDAPAPVAAAEPTAGPAAEPDAPFALTDQQVTFFETFGFLRVPGLFAPDVDRLVTGFEEVFAANPTWETHEPLHFDEQRLIIPGFISKSDHLRDLQHDPRVVSIVTTLIGPDYEWAESDGNLFSCDTSWHPDNYQSPLEQVHVKLSFYLDPLHGENGAIRMIPGTNHWQTKYASGLRRDVHEVSEIEEIFGVTPAEIPSWTLESEPGDVIIWSFRTIHGSFNGGNRRRLFSLNFREPDAPAA
jgi:hypothetical protein